MLKLSGSVQCFALIGTNVLNLLILRLVQGAVMRSQKASKSFSSLLKPNSKVDAPFLANSVETLVKLALMYLGPGALERIIEDPRTDRRQVRPRRKEYILREY